MPNSFVGTSDKVDDNGVGEADFRNGLKHAVQTPSSLLFTERSGRQVRVRGQASSRSGLRPRSQRTIATLLSGTYADRRFCTPLREPSFRRQARLGATPRRLLSRPDVRRARARFETPAPTEGGPATLALSPRSKRVRPELGTTAFVLGPDWAGLSQRRRRARQPRRRRTAVSPRTDS
jgi:hypothetical protein